MFENSKFFVRDFEYFENHCVLDFNAQQMFS